MDEPTNDLDAETLELLEEVISNFKGTLLLVSHDRAFLNNVVQSTLAFEENGTVREMAGGYDDYIAHQRNLKPAPHLSKKQKSKTKPRPKNAQKLTYKEKKLLETLPEKILALEKEKTALQEQINLPGFFKLPHEETTSVTKRLEILEAELLAAYSQWESLDARA